MIAKYGSAVNMIPLFKTNAPEEAARLLLGHFRHVVIDCRTFFSFDQKWQIRFRPDLITGYEVYFNKVASQVKLWRENGGALIRRSKVGDELQPGPHDAVLLIICPGRIRPIQEETADTKSIAVIREPVHWRAQEARLAQIQQDKTERAFITAGLDLDALKTLVGVLPVFSRKSLQNLPPSPELSQLSSARVSHVNVVRSPDTTY